MPRMSNCWSCEGQVPDGAAFCPQCGHSQTDRSTRPLFVVDATTGLFNAVFIHAIVEQEGNRAIRYRRPLSVLVVELDHAEHIHRDLGAAQIDVLMRELAEVLGHTVRDTDTLGFISTGGPPRFAVVLPETDHDGALLAADKIRRAVSAHDFQAGGQWQRLTLSCGAATVNPDRMGHQDLIELAAMAVEEGRSHGPNRTHAHAHF
jgi:diguanylate cyclase (GGDEF)-like protein